jgi:Cellulase (glycosyl hydrolase family 5)
MTKPTPLITRFVRSRRRVVTCLVVLALVSGMGTVCGPLASGPAEAYGLALQTAVEAYPPPGPEGELALARVRALGAHFVRLVLPWSAVAPVSPSPGFEPTNPNDPAYRWQEFDRVITAAVTAGLEPIVDISSPPWWAQSPPGAGTKSPEPVSFGQFAAAAATRYDGSTPGLPRVRYWEVWNEPNASFFLQPQTQAGRIVSVTTYRTMIESFAAGVHGVRADNIVIGGELFPNGVNSGELTAIAPLEFTRRLFCISAGPRPRRVCNAHVPVDVWSVHPYTSGSPSTLPANPNNVWIANLSALSQTVQAAQRLGTLVSPRPARTWVTEFSWDSNPPDPKGVPMGIEQRWVAEAIYRSWTAGISVFTWFSLSDQPLGSSPFQSGLYFECPGGLVCATSKPIAASFRFPFVAYGQPRHRVLVWGRTPAGVRATIQVQWLQGSSWRGLVKLRTDSDGIFTARVRLPRQVSSASGLLRAVELGAGPSPAFSLRASPNIPATPFGS